MIVITIEGLVLNEFVPAVYLQMCYTVISEILTASLAALRGC